MPPAATGDASLWPRGEALPRVPGTQC